MLVGDKARVLAPISAQSYSSLGLLVAIYHAIAMESGEKDIFNLIVPRERAGVTG